MALGVVSSCEGDESVVVPELQAHSDTWESRIFVQDFSAPLPVLGAGGGERQVLSPRPIAEGMHWAQALLIPLGPVPMSKVTDRTRCGSNKALVMLRQRISCPRV